MNQITPLENLYQAASYIQDENEKDIIRKAYETAKKHHDGQLRKNGEPYFNHCVATAINIADQSMDYETICAGLMHDTLEDTSYTHEEMEKDFGEPITHMVEGVTKLGKLKYSGAERHVESLRKFFFAINDDIRVVVIKLCDRLHNVTTLEYVREDKRKRIAIETIEIHARLADRLGMGKLKAQLEDGAFPYAHEQEYQKVKNILKEKKDHNSYVLNEIVKTLKEELSIFDVNIENVDSRVKHLYSLWEKLKKYNYDIDKIYDIIAIRVIVPNISDCYQTLGIIHGLYKPVPSRFKDYIASPKPNGYKSLHTAIFTGSGQIVEIQIRTPEMHEEAEYGIASHLAYKEKKSKNKTEIKTEWTSELLEWQKDITKEKGANKKFMEHLREDFFNQRVFVFTPLGDVIDLPEGSTPLDFAYQVHTDIGDKAYRAYVNNKLVPFNYILQKNDIVRIETNEKAVPSRKWLSMS
ncbi:MAG: diphosphokinase / guanosine-3,5-bis(diphosphate) 3-diphosphatase, partial [Patescibacteria group bacterium]|nr:diphosphokinase / guanosine-3,5-bis(diphosphate) 3-diphosphatase [Patescibacteria group bacterium]